MGGVCTASPLGQDARVRPGDAPPPSAPCGGRGSDGGEGGDIGFREMNHSEAPSLLLVEMKPTVVAAFVTLSLPQI